MGKHNKASTANVLNGHFKDNQNYLQPIFYTDDNFEAMELIQKALAKEGIMIMIMIEATFKWLLRHCSASGDQDGVLLGASSLT